MNDILVGLGLVLVLEGLLWALAPDMARKIVIDLARMPEGQLKKVAWGFVAVGTAIVWLVRG